MDATLPPDAVLLARATPRQRQAAQEFAAQALSQLLAPAFATVDPAHGAFGGGEGESQWRPMLVEAMAKTIARADGPGIGAGLAQPVLREMLRLQALRESGA